MLSENNLLSFVIAPFILITPLQANSTENNTPMQNCFLKQIENSAPETTVKQLTRTCELLINELAKNKDLKDSHIASRIAREISASANPNVITSHKRNYFIPVSYVNHPNEAPFRELLTDKPLDNLEAKFQLSFKAPVFTEIFTKYDALHFGFTLQSYWQMYNTELSSPFR